MAELLIVLCVLGVVLAIVTLVGHGIWVFLSLLFGSRRSQSRADATGGTAAAGRRSCPRCGTAFDLNEHSCAVCGWPTGKQPQSNQSALRTVREQVERLARLELIDATARDRLVDVVMEEERRVAADVAATLATEEAKSSSTRGIQEPPLAEPVAHETASPPLPATPELQPSSAAGGKPFVPVAEVPSPSPLPLGERARKYAASRESAAAEALAEPLAHTPGEPPKQREALSRLLAAFMEENNIRWGELVGGLLIVGCSIALVISFWSQIAERPLLKFVLFNGVTAALFGIGLYTDRRWKIHTTSHGLLVTATLLVPLNFLAIAAFTQATPPSDVLFIGGEAVSLAVFSGLVFLAGRVLVPDAAPLLVAGVMIPSLMQLVVRRFAGPAVSLAGMSTLAAVPIVSYLATTSLVTRRRWLEGTARLSEAEAPRVLTFLGLVSEATVIPLALLAYMSPPLYETLHRLSPLLVTCGLPALLVGLLFWRRGERGAGGWGRASGEPPDAVLSGGSSATADLRLSLDPSHPVKDHASTGLQTAGITVGVLGALIMIGAIVLAWPDPATLLPTTLVTAVVLTLVATWFGIPAAHLPAGAALAGAWLVGFHLLRGNVAWTLPSYEPMKSALLSATSGHALVPLVAIFGGLAAWLSRGARREALADFGELSRVEPVAHTAGFMYGLVTAATAAVSLGWVLWFGWGRVGDPQNVTWTLGIYALAALAAATVLDRAPLAWIAAVLLFATMVQGIVYRFGPTWEIERPRLVALLAYATLAMVLHGGLVGLLRRGQAHLQPVLAWSALATSIGAAAILVATASATSAESLAVHLAWLAVVWLFLAGLAGWPQLFIASQVALVLAIVCGVTAVVETREWYSAARHPWLDPWFLEAQGVALAAYCLAMGMVRGFSGWSLAGGADSQRITKPRASAWAVERVVEVGLMLLVVGVAAYGAMPGVAQELAPLEEARGDGPAVRVVLPIEQFQIAGIPHTHAADRGAWALVAAVAAMLVAELWRAEAASTSGESKWRLLGLLAVVAAVCPLLAARWEPDVAVASALRWLLAGMFAVVSVPVWFTRREVAANGLLESGGGALADFGELSRVEPMAQWVRDFLVAVVVLVYVLMGVYVCQAALQLAGLPQGATWLWPYVAGWAVLAGVAAVVVPRAAAAGSSTGERAAWGLHARDVLAWLAVAPPVILIMFALALALDQHPIVGPELGSWFRRIGWDVSYGVPLAVTGLVFVGYAVRDRSPGFAFAAGLLFNTVATIVVLLRLARGGGQLDAAAWITVAQVNAIVAGIVALVWLAAVQGGERGAKSKERDSGTDSRRSSSSPLARRWPTLLVTQVALAAALCGTFFVPAVINLAFEPRVSSWAAAADGVLGWLAAALATIAAVWINGRRGVGQNGASLFVAAVVALIALTATRWDTGNWLAFHTLLIGCSAAAWLLPLATRSINRALSHDGAMDAPLVWSALAVRFFAVAAVILGIRGAIGDPTGPWWSFAALVAISARNVWIAWFERRRGFMWIAAPLFSIAVNIWWDASGSAWLGSGAAGSGTLDWIWINVIALAAMAVVSASIERWRILPLASEPLGWRGLAFHRFAAWVIVGVLFVVTGIGLLRDLDNQSLAMNVPLAAAAWVAALIAAGSCCWDPAVRWPVACLYCVGLVGEGLFLDGLSLQPPLFHWALALSLAAYSLATSALWSVREPLRAFAASWGMPVEMESESSPRRIFDRRDSATWAGSGHGWLVPANFLIGVGVLALVWWIEQTMENFTQRMVAAYAVGAQAFALGLLARGAVRTGLQYLALVWGVFFGVAFGWAWLSPDFPAPWLHRLVVGAAALAIAVVVYGFGLVKFLKRENEWTRAAARLVPLLAVVAVALILSVLAIETRAYMRQGSVPIRPAALVTVGLALIGLAVAALVAALVPGRDPLGLSERGRTLYVYAAEALAALLFLHIRVTMPWLFSGWFLRFWPLVVMVIAFVGVGLGELFQRRRQRVLSEPLQTTGALLPLLPVLGFWVISSEVHYSLLLLSIGVLYAALSVLRHSFFYGVLAAVAANASLWYLLNRGDGLGLFEHPQLWLIPPALCALAAGYINRERMTGEQSAALRYFAAIVIYVSSTADVFINGVADAPWLPAVLAGLSIVGVLAGIMLRVRAFLYLGTAFLVVALMTIIWHAAIHQQRTWILWVAGIVTGVAIIALFGLFEKRRDDVLRVVEQLKHWEA